VKLTRVDFDQVDGLQDLLSVDDLDPGLNVVLGENGSGKSTLVAVVRRSLWPKKSTRRLEARTSWSLAGGASQEAVVRGHSVSWTRQPEGALCPVPPEQLGPCYTLGIRDLLAAKNQGDQELARRIRRAMRGGFDLDELRDAFPDRDSMARKARKSRDVLSSASTTLSDLRREFRKLAKDEDRLAQLEERTEAAYEAKARLGLLDTAAKLSAERQQHVLASARLAEVPPAMAALKGDEAVRVQEIQDQGLAARERLEALLLQLQGAGLEAESTGLGGEPLDPGVLNGQRKRAQRLVTDMAALADLRERSDAADGALKARHQHLAASTADTTAEVPGTAALDQLEQLLFRCLDNHGQMVAAESKLKLLGEPVQQAERQQLAAAVHALREWLRAPASQSQLRAPSWLAIVATACIALGIAAGWFITHGLFAVAGLGVGLLLGLVVLRQRSTAAPSDLEGARSAFNSTGRQAPDRWQRDSVSERLGELEQLLVRAESELANESQRKSLEASVEALQEQADGLHHSSNELRVSMGLEGETGIIETVETARRLAAWRDSAAHCAELQEQLAAADSRHGTELAELAHYLQEHGAQEGNCGTAEMVLEQLEDLRVRNERLATAHTEQRRLESEIETSTEAIRESDAKLEQFFADLGLGDGATGRLDELLAGLRDYQAQVEQAQVLAVAIATRECALAEEPGWLQLSEQQVQEVRAELEALVDQYTSLNEETQRIQVERDRARSGKRHEDANAAKHAAHEALYQLHEDALRNDAAHFLIDSVESEFEDESRPEVLRKAMELFASFTRMAYRLELRGTDPPRLLACDTSTRLRYELSELSDATRIQCLLAVRLAFATAQESGTPLPLFLDEALSTSDPTRFAAVSDVLLDLVQKGRQVFYLTANPADVAAWSRVCAERGMPGPKVVELGELRDEHRAVRSADELRPIGPSVPPPGALEPAEYGALLGPPRPNRFAPVESLDLFYPLMDRLPLLYALRCNHIKTTGQWLELDGLRSAAGSVLDKSERQALSVRVHMARRYLEHWRVGRGKPVTRADLEESGCVSGTFLEPMGKCLASHDGQAQALLDAIDSKTIKRFRGGNRNELAEYFIREGFIDRREVLSRVELEAMLLSDLDAEIGERALDTSAVRDFVTVMNSVCAVG